MQIEILGRTVEAELTTDSPKSSYGLPVLRVDGEDYGPGDWVGALKAGDIAILGRLQGTRDFLDQHPEASRWWDLSQVTY